jgi:uncharacterized protein (TIGR02145 family)
MISNITAMKAGRMFIYPVAALFFICTAAMTLWAAGQSSSGTVKKPDVKDNDGREITTVTIGRQVWMAENLNVVHYLNGDVIPQVQDPGEWERLTSGAWCFYENKTENGVTYGRLYNWYAVNDPRGLAPKGWHIPSDDDWEKLSGQLGGNKAAGGRLKSTRLWKAPNAGAGNSCGFSAFPAGYRSGTGTFYLQGSNASFWSSTEKSAGLGWVRELYASYSAIYRNFNAKQSGFSVRCVRD